MRILALALASTLVTAPAIAETKIRASFDKVAGLPFQVAVKASVLEAATGDPGVSLVVDEIERDPAEHLRHIEAAIAAKADALIVNIGDHDTGRKVAALAAAAGLPLVFLNRRPNLDRVPDKVSIVSSNDLAAGRMQARVLADRLKGKGAVAILRGPDHNTAAAERRMGMGEVLAGYPGLTVVAEADANWSRDVARRSVAGWLTEGRRVDAIITANDQMALGAVEALKAAGLAGKVLVGGVDGSREAVEAVRSGEMLCTVFQNGPAQGSRAVADAAKLARGEHAQQYDWVPYEIIVAGNAEQYLRR